MFRINKKVIDSEKELDDTSVKKYIHLLKKENSLIVIDNVIVDAKNLIKRRFSCNPKKCTKRKKLKNGKIVFIDKSCCGLPEIVLSSIELKKIKKISPFLFKLLKKYHPRIKYTLRSIIGKNRYDQYFIKKTPNNKHCILSYFNEKGILRCAIDSVCEKLGFSSVDYKPYLCSLWPLQYFEFDNNKILLTVCSREAEKMLENMPESCSEFKCMERQDLRDPPLYISMKNSIIFLLGENFWKRLKVAAKKLNPLDRF